MKTSKLIVQYKFIIFLLTILFLPFLTGCHSPELKVSEYEFVYKGKSYVIRSSYCPDNPRSCNQLIGKDFIAVDINQDRIMDKIKKGNISLSEAQEIYDYSLNLLEKAGKLSEIEKDSKQYETSEGEFTFTIKTFSSNGDNHFAEFRITDRRSGLGQFKESIFIDDKADGNLDEIVKAGFVLEEAQKLYSKTIEKGIKQMKLEIDNGILRIK